MRKHIINRFSFLKVFLFAAVLAVAAACHHHKAEAQVVDIYIPVAGDVVKASDYSNKNNWLALPEVSDKKADIFYIYPTTWVAAKGEFPVCGIDNGMMRAGAKNTLKTQASAFEGAGNVYAPYYRQLDAVFALSLPTYEEQEKYFGGLSGTDITAAFDFYIKNYNNGRPFIIVGHSQGAVMTKLLLFKYLKDNPDVYKRMIAAYVIGYSVTKDEMAANPHLKFAQNADDTGVVISYNTEAEGVTAKNYTLLEDSLVINPISWSRSDKLAAAKQSLGSRMEEDGGFVKKMNFADAKLDLDRGVVVCDSIDPDDYYDPDHPFAAFFPKGIYHFYDVHLYYYNLKANAENRVDQYLKKAK